jgi:integrase
MGRRRRLAAPTREAAELLLAEKIRESRQAAPPVDDQDITIAEYARRWLEQIAPAVAPSTLENYSQQLRIHVLPTFGPMKLRHLHRHHVKALLVQKRTGGLSRNTVKLIRATLSVLLADAVDDEIILHNPATGVARRGRKGPDSITAVERQKRIVPMHPHELATFLAVAEARCSRHFSALFLLLSDTGLRPGEASGLQWDDVDLAGRRVRVERAVDDEGRLRPTKTAERRFVDLTRRLELALRDLQAQSEAEALRLGKSPNAWVFPNRRGRPIRPKRIAKVFRKVLLAAGLRHFRLYDLRHSFASHLLGAGLPITYVAAQLGHRTPTTTLLYYAHYLPTGDKGFIDRLEALRQDAVPHRVADRPDDHGLLLDDEALNELH